MSQLRIKDDDIIDVAASKVTESVTKVFVTPEEKAAIANKAGIYYPQHSLVVFASLPSAATYNDYECAVGNLIYHSNGVVWTLLTALDQGTFFFDQDSSLYQVSQLEGVNNKLMFATKADIEALLTGIITTHNHYVYEPIALSNNGSDATDLSAGVKLTQTITVAENWHDVTASLLTAATGQSLRVDIKKNGTSIFSTLLSIDASEITSVTAAIPKVLTSTPIVWAVGDIQEFNIERVGSIVKGKGLIINVKKTY